MGLEIAQDPYGALTNKLVLDALVVFLDESGVTYQLPLIGASGMPARTADALLELRALIKGSPVLFIGSFF